MTISPKTRQELLATHPEGTRHHAMIKIAMDMIGNGLAPEAVFQQLRATFPDADKTDREINDVIAWVMKCDPQPSGYGKQGGATPRQFTAGRTSTPPRPMDPKEKARKVLGGTSVSASEWLAKSPVPIPDDPVEATIKFFEYLYTPEDHINLLRRYTMQGDRPCPSGGGSTLPRDKWIEWFRRDGIPAFEAGCWMRHSPCRPGAGSKGGVTDADIASHRFLLIESDSLSIDEQFALYDKLRLPIAALVGSGGDSIHAWLRVDATSAAHFRQIVDAIYAALIGLGFDSSCKNPSRLCRLPGAIRKLGAKGDGLQRLYYLNPTPPELDVERFLVSCEPIENLVSAKDMGPIMAEYMRPKPEPFTLPIFRINNPYAEKYELEGFYMNPGEVTIWTGVTRHGKSSMIANVMYHSVISEKPIWVASFEHLPAQTLLLLCRIGCEQPPTAKMVQFFTTDIGDRIQFCDIVGSIKPELLYRQMRTVIEKFKVEHLFIDSLMRVQGLDEDYPAQGQFMNDLQAIAKETNTHIHLVAHPGKGDETICKGTNDIRGSALLAANADNVVSVWRNMKKQAMREEKVPQYELDKVHDCELYVSKQRATGWMGKIKLNYDLKSRRFTAFTEPAKPFRP